jgi:microcystin degradation protein MlrC
MDFRVLTAEVFHETNTFSRLHTDEEAFRNRLFLLGEDAVAERGNVNTEIAGFFDVAGARDWEIDHVLSVAAGPSGYVTRAAFDWFCGPIVDRTSTGNHNGILLALHGAMVPDFCEDGEGELLRRIRAVVGPSVPIAVTLDPHANVTQLMCELADILVSFKTYPHVDMRDTARQAANILHRTMAGEIKPRTIMARPPMLKEVNGGRTDIGPMIERLAKARAYEERDDAFAVSVNGGFASADIAEVGPSVLVTGQGDYSTHIAFAKEISDDIWASRHDVLNTYLTVEAAAALASSYQSAEGPLIIADYADNPGGGAYGDSTALLEAMLIAKIDDACFGPIVDSSTVQALSGLCVGSQVNVDLGGKTDPVFGGGPLHVKAELVRVSDGHFTGDGPMIGGLAGSFGPSLVIRVDGIEILVTSSARQIMDLQQFKAFGINPECKRIVALKSMQHFRAAFEPIAGQVIVCDSGALCTPNYARMSYENVRRPIFPLGSEVIE